MTGSEHPRSDQWTVIAIAVVAYLLANVLHEGIGHGGARLLARCDSQALTTAYFASYVAANDVTSIRLVSVD